MPASYGYYYHYHYYCYRHHRAQGYQDFFAYVLLNHQIPPIHTRLPHFRPHSTPLTQPRQRPCPSCDQNARASSSRRRPRQHFHPHPHPHPHPHRIRIRTCDTGPYLRTFFLPPSSVSTPSRESLIQDGEYHQRGTGQHCRRVQLYGSIFSLSL